MAISAARVGGATRAGASARCLLGVVLLLEGAVATACGRPGGFQTGPTSATRPARQVSSEPGSLDLTQGPPERSTTITSDPLWRRAALGDPIDLARLAEREGAAGLLIGVELGRTPALTALSALPHAEDAELALKRLCELAAEVSPAQVEPVLRAVHGIVKRPPRSAERLDVEGARSCSARLGELAASERLSPQNRDLAASARAMLSEHAQN